MEACELESSCAFLCGGLSAAAFNRRSCFFVEACELVCETVVVPCCVEVSGTVVVAGTVLVSAVILVADLLVVGLLNCRSL